VTCGGPAEHATEQAVCMPMTNFEPSDKDRTEFVNQVGIGETLPPLANEVVEKPSGEWSATPG